MKEAEKYRTWMEYGSDLEVHEAQQPRTRLEGWCEED